MRPMPVLCPGTAGTPPASYAREPRAQPPCRHILRVSALPAADSAPGAAMGTASACATPEPLHRLQPLLLDRAEMTSGNPNQTCQAPTARSATPGRGCHRPPRPTFAVTLQEHLNSTQDHQKVCTSPPNLSGVFRNSTVLLFSCKETTPFIASLHSDAISLLQRREVQRLSPLTGSQYPLKSSKSCDLRAHSPGFVYLSVCVLAFVRANVHDLCTVRVHAWQCCIARRTGTSTYGCACGRVRAGVRKLQLKSCFPMVCKICAWAFCVRFLSGGAL